MLERLGDVTLLTMMEVVGPIVLGAALAYAILKSRRRSGASKIETEIATRKLYREAAEEERKQERT